METPRSCFRLDDTVIKKMEKISMYMYGCVDITKVLQYLISKKYREKVEGKNTIDH
jgi:hypothetical protein